MSTQTFTYEEEETKKTIYLERLRAYVSMQLKKDVTVDKWLALQIEIEQIQYHIESIEYRLRTRESQYYFNNYDNKRTQLI